jgi:hypothetical protein
MIRGPDKQLGLAEKCLKVKNTGWKRLHMVNKKTILSPKH